ncbi:ATP-dependent DNA helicase PIF1 [Holothuria leucospilota]|uniref:ATP-dependent DNA helicase n=1 Tax=Holothuria leucospilota TaxID=206669 RepID=A0A9Q1BLX8_HOLLE|nr:ATP-dependent DNA helicase PIF1 [Holothuria leucospilota]
MQGFSQLIRDMLRIPSTFFFAQYSTELHLIHSSIAIAMRKGKTKTSSGRVLTSRMLQNRKHLKELIGRDDGYHFMKNIRGTPAYWESTLKDLFAMIRQLGIPTWFCSFSAADRRWKEINTAILKQQGKSIPSNINWKMHCDIIASNPVTAARMFEHRMQNFLHNVIFSLQNPIGEIVDYFYRIEFQQRGWPHLHCLFWVKNAPRYSTETDDTLVIDFIDKYVSCSIPSEEHDKELHDIVCSVQTYSKNHSKSCKKNHKTCRFNFPKPPSQQTFIATPVEHFDSIDQDKKRAKEMIAKIWDVLQHNDISTMEEFFSLTNTTQKHLEQVLSKLSAKETIFLRRNPNECWVNNYNPDLLRTWNANMDIQYVLNPYSCIMYIVSYISKAEREMGTLLKLAQQEARDGNVDAMSELRQLGTVYLNHREVSLMEAVYRVTGMHLKKTSRKVVYIPLDPNAQRITLPLAVIQNKQEDTEEIWADNIIDKYLARPKTECFLNMCLAIFASDHSTHRANPSDSSVMLESDLGYIKPRSSKRCIIRYCRTKAEKDPEKYYHGLLRLYLPHVHMEIRSHTTQTYEHFFLNGQIKLGKETRQVKEIVIHNMSQFETITEEMDEAWETIQHSLPNDNAWCDTQILNTSGTEAENEDESVFENGIIDSCEQIPELTAHGNMHSTHSVSSHDLPRPLNQQSATITSAHYQSLNEKQRSLFRFITTWCYQRLHSADTVPFHVFLTGGAGTGKSLLVKCIKHETEKIFRLGLPSADAITILLLAFTGTAAFNIHGQTIHSALSIQNTKMPYIPLGQETLNTLRVKYEHLQVIIIDEVSMVDVDMLSYINCRLQQIKGSSMHEPFGNVSILAVGDFYQLPPIRGKPLFDIDPGALVNLWNIDVDEHNHYMLTQTCKDIITITAVDVQYDKKGQKRKRKEPIHTFRQCNLLCTLTLAVGAKVMLTTNIDVSDGLVNGVCGTVDNIFQPGMAYVALSRVTSMKGLYLLNFSPHAIYSNPKMMSLDALCKMKPGPAPYNKLIKCKVVQVSTPKPFSTNGQEKVLHHLAICDNYTVLKATLYDPGKLNVMSVGATVMIANYILKPDKSVTLTTASKVFRCADMSIDEKFQSVADELINPPPKPIEPCRKVKLSPQKTMTSVQGKIIKDEAIKQVIVRGQTSTVRNIFVKDNSDEIEVALWRKAAETKAFLNDWVEITNVVVNPPNDYHKEPFVASTQNTNITVKAAPSITVEAEIVAFTIENELFKVLLTTSDDTTPREYSLSEDILRQILLLPSTISLQELQTTLADEIPLKTTLIMQNEVIIAAQTSEGLLESDA